MLTFFIISKLENYHLSKISIYFSALMILMLISSTRVKKIQNKRKAFYAIFKKKNKLSKKDYLFVLLGSRRVNKIQQGNNVSLLLA
jgi:hypothetical protein